MTGKQEEQIVAWVESELANGGTITKAEATTALVDFAKQHGITITEEMAAQAEAGFDYVASIHKKDGVIDGKEMETAIKRHRKDYEEHCGGE